MDDLPPPPPPLTRTIGDRSYVERQGGQFIILEKMKIIQI